MTPLPPPLPRNWLPLGALDSTSCEREEKIMIIIIIIITVKSMLTGHSQNPLYGQNNQLRSWTVP